jgi:hypothetical protein
MGSPGTQVILIYMDYGCVSEPAPSWSGESGTDVWDAGKSKYDSDNDHFLLTRVKRKQKLFYAALAPKRVKN